jgi:hypothetical protein
VARVLVLPARQVRVTGEELILQSAGLLKGDVRDKVGAQVVVEAAVSHPVQQAEIARLCQLPLVLSDILQVILASHRHRGSGVGVHTGGERLTQDAVGAEQSPINSPTARSSIWP